MRRGNYFLRALDRTLGVPIVLGLSLLKQRRVALSSEPRRIGILLSAAIGDSVLFQSVVSDIRQKYPETEITVFVGCSNYEYAKEYFGVNVIALNITSPWDALRTLLQQECFDIWIDTGQWQRITSIYSFFVKANWKIGFQTPGQGRHFVFDSTVRHNANIHELENFRELARQIGVEHFTNPILSRTSSAIEGRIVIHVFAGGSKPYLKQWPESYWVETINVLQARGKHIILTGLLGDQPIAERITQQTSDPSRVEVVAGKLSLKETIQILSSAECVVSVNTGILHIAAALGVRTIGLSGPTSVKRWGPIGPQAVGIQSPRQCSPCLNLGFDYGCPRNDCMKDLEVEMLLKLLA